ncbi:MAG: hypothetical protein FD144_4753 [Rhodospirillaceae bacterium]|nr:MAG: hypothetical protein FD144_4753 [Rhodospirillaceae bacterium]
MSEQAPTGTQAYRWLVGIGTAATVALASWKYAFVADRGWG